MAAIRMALLITLLCGAVLAQPSPAIQRYLKQPGFTWTCDQSAHFQFCYEPALKGDANLAVARDGAEAARTWILRFNGIPSYEPVIHVFFLKSPERMQKLIGFHGEGRSRPAVHAIFFVPTPVRPDLKHELSHEILTNLWGAAEPWIEEGFAALAAEPAVVHMTCLSMMVRHAMLPLARLVSADWDPSVESPDITYPELAGFVEFLTQKYGREQVREVWSRGAESIPDVLGKSVSALEEEWRTRLEHEAAARSKPPKQ